MEKLLQRYVEEFNRTDEECYKNAVDNAAAYEWLEGEIPLFECPDSDIERTYYFRYWTYRKHLKQTDEGYIITEFLPPVPWAGEENAIVAPVMHHFSEGRWLRNAKRYLTDYINFFLARPEGAHAYSTPLLYSALLLSRVTGCYDYGKDFLSKAVAHYGEWERTHAHPSGLFWSVDDRDAMELSVSGTTPDGRVRRGLRPTLNAYLAADAWAIAEFAERAGETATAEKYHAKYKALKALINEKLWEDGFYRAFHYDDGCEDAAFAGKSGAPRELIGYIPFIFDLAPAGREGVFALLGDEKAFLATHGITTLEQSNERFLFEHSHECLWNGYVWPFATAQTLTALIRVMQTATGEQFKPLFVKLLGQYARAHHLITEDGRCIPWIDEVRHPYRDEWTSRTILKGWGWKPGGYERGKDYNHSSFCDLVISGLCGVSVEGDTLTAFPAVPDEWDYFRLSHLPFRSRLFTVLYDRDGTRYGRGAGLHIFEE